VLEYIGTAEARKLLEKLARGDAGGLLARDARAGPAGRSRTNPLSLLELHHYLTWLGAMERGPLGIGIWESILPDVHQQQIVQCGIAILRFAICWKLHDRAWRANIAARVCSGPE
jgi:hypothetical protein